MNSLLAIVVSCVLNAIWQIPLIAAAGWAAAKILRRWGPQQQHRVWVATLLLSAVVPAAPALRALCALIPWELDGLTGASASVSSGVLGAAQPPALWLLPGWLMDSIFTLYVAATGWSAVRLVWLSVSAAALRRAASPANPEGNSAQLWDRTRAAFPGASSTLLLTGNVPGIVTTGIARPAIVLPPGFIRQCGGLEFLSALAHELAHVERRDYAKNLLYELAAVVAAFHPVAWLVKAQIVRTREIVCDAIAAERLVGPANYRQSLLRLAERMVALRPAGTHAIGMFDANILEERIMALKSKKIPLGSSARAVRLASVTVLLLASAVIGTAFAKGVASSSKQDHPWGAVYKIGPGVTAPVLKYAPDPEYPRDKAAKAPVGTTVTCVVGLIVAPDGAAHDVHIVRPAGKDFDANAVSVVRRYQFKPALRQGKPVAVSIDIEVNYRKY